MTTTRALKFTFPLEEGSRAPYIKGDEIGTKNTVSFLLGDRQIIEVTKYTPKVLKAFIEWVENENNYKRACKEWDTAHPKTTSARPSIQSILKSRKIKKRKTKTNWCI